jgi:uncharacterized membrane protein
MWDLITGGIAAVASGGITGLLGIGLQRAFDWLGERERAKREKQQQEHQVNMLRANAEVQAQEWAARTRMAETEAAGRQAVAEQEAFAASFRLEPERYAVGARPKGWIGAAGWFLMVLIDFIRGFVRPGLTVYLCAITTLIYFEAKALLERYGMVIPADMAFDLVKQIILTILYLTTTCILWWFGTRNPAKPPSR